MISSLGVLNVSFTDNAIHALRTLIFRRAWDSSAAVVTFPTTAAAGTVFGVVSAGQLYKQKIPAIRASRQRVILNTKRLDLTIYAGTPSLDVFMIDKVLESVRQKIFLVE
jgi:hypothetical protein